MSKKVPYVSLALLGSAVCQFLIFYRIERAMATARMTGVFQPPEFYYILNVVFAGLAVLLMLGMLRRGTWWQRLIAAVFCLYPVIILVISGNGAIRLLLEP